jgi:hypothetical protein
MPFKSDKFKNNFILQEILQEILQQILFFVHRFDKLESFSSNLS